MSDSKQVDCSNQGLASLPNFKDAQPSAKVIEQDLVGLVEGCGNNPLSALHWAHFLKPIEESLIEAYLSDKICDTDTLWRDKH